MSQKLRAEVPAQSLWNENPGLSRESTNVEKKKEGPAFARMNKFPTRNSGAVNSPGIRFEAKGMLHFVGSTNAGILKLGGVP